MKRAILLVLLVAGALAVSPPAGAATRQPQIDRGIIQSVSSSQLVLRGLDGSTITINVDAQTRVFLNDVPSSLSALQPGFAAGALHDGAQPARVVKAFGRRRAERQIDKGIVVSVSPSQLVLRGLDGAVVTVGVDAHTQVVLDGQPASLSDLKPGFLAAALHFGTAPARAVRALSRRQR